MPFTRAVREQALIAAARHCCVCRRYKGIKLEVHHLLPEADGGTNTIENAIVLCFDCHTDAGHYNPRHPRGIKYSKAELIRARDTWFRRVTEGGLTDPGAASPVHARYLICRTFELLTEICGGDLSRVPAERTLLARNPVLQFMTSVTAAQGVGYRHARVLGDGYSETAEYLARYPDARVTSKSNPAEAYYALTRKPSADDIQRVAREDAVSRLLTQQGVSPDEIVRVFAYEEVCGGAQVQEIFRLRPLWAVFLAATNVSDEPLYLDGIVGPHDFEGTGQYRALDDVTAEENFMKLPGAPLGPAQTALIPVATVLAPHYPIAEDALRTADEYIDPAYVQSVSRVHLLYDRVSLINTWGPVLRPKRLLVRRGAREETIDVHELDFDNVFVVDRHWEMGSCPHLFTVSFDGTVNYSGELLASRPGAWHSDAIALPPETSYAVIAELEDEVTDLLRVEQDGVVLAKNVSLDQGMMLVLAVRSNPLLIVEGRYRTRRGTVGVRDPGRRGDLVGTALHKLQRDMANPEPAQAVVA